MASLLEETLDLRYPHTAMRAIRSAHLSTRTCIRLSTSRSQYSNLNARPAYWQAARASALAVAVARDEVLGPAVLAGLLAAMLEVFGAILQPVGPWQRY